MISVIISARMGSDRLPEKALVSYCPDGMSNLEQIFRRWQTSKRSPRIIIATTDRPEDEPIADVAEKLNTPCYRGSAEDVTGRMEGAIQKFSPDAKYVIRALADNPLVDVDLSDWRVDVLSETGAEGLHYGGMEPRITYCGTTDVWGRDGWRKIVEGSSGSQREHPGVYFYENLHKFAVIQLPPPRREYLQPVRTELDTEKDLEMFRAVWRAWDDALPAFETVSEYERAAVRVPTLWALEWLGKHPEVSAINALVPVKTQAYAQWPKGSLWRCPECQKRAGNVVTGNLHLNCPNCGKPVKYYAQKPTGR